MSLPDPGGVRDRAADLAATTADAAGDPTAPNVAVVRTDAAYPDGVERTDVGFEGPGAGDLGRLAAARAAVDGDDACFHFPEPTFTAEGPWVIVAPLAGRIATVARGTGGVTVAVTVPPGPVTSELRHTADRIDGVFSAAQLSHEHYPVETDDIGVFTNGLTTFALGGVDGGADEVRLTFDVGTTPATSPAAVEARFSAAEGVVWVDYEPDVPVERASPGNDLRAAVEAAHERVRGDAEYEWLHGPTVFTNVPGGDKVALGTGVSGAETYATQAYEECVELLSATLSGVDR